MIFCMVWLAAGQSLAAGANSCEQSPPDFLGQVNFLSTCDASLLCPVARDAYRASFDRYDSPERVKAFYEGKVDPELLRKLLEEVPTFESTLNQLSQYPTGTAKSRGCLADYEHAALWSYTTFNYGFLNQALRDRRRKPLTEDERVLTSTIRCALDRLPDYRGTASRYVVMNRAPEGFLEAHAPGSVVRYSAFTSASDCVDRKPGKQFLIHSVHGKQISELSALGNAECEVIFRPGTCFKVDRRIEPGADPMGAQVEMTEVPCPTGAAADKIVEY